ncbi:helix-turn-helix domain-containing protein [Aquisalimonas sp.]|uniref:GlxA family transcriptional regulator n=1 Tax=unclassified Aquisalimonas TaxID=2644645 RepID=UPI0025BDE2FA|nr:helix-turn-helix domain-containing protein [Aquisalimonas sp.]
MIHVTVVLLNAGLPSTAVAPVEVFQCAGTLWNTLVDTTPEPSFDVTTASVDGGPVECAAPLVMQAACSIDAIDRTDLIFIPTGGLDVQEMLSHHAPLIPWLQAHHAADTRIALVCTGVAFAAAAGLLDGHRATTHWAAAPDYARLFPAVDWHPELLVTEHERILCGGGVYSAIDLAMYLVEKFCGHQVALETARALLINMPRSYQSGYAVLPLSRPHEDEAVRAAEEWIQGHFAGEIRFETVAQSFAMSPRNFTRRFKAATGKLPGAYLQELRVAVARSRLEHGRASVQVIGREVGYDDPDYFREIFRRHTGLSPKEYRLRFGSAAAPVAEAHA